MRLFLACILLAISVNLLHQVPAAAAPSWALEYRSWQGFYGATSFELRYEPTSPLGFRLWSAHGWDDDHCASIGQCFQNRFAGADLTYRVNPRMRIYLGFQDLSRELIWDGVRHTMFHSGFRVGVLGEVRLADRLAFTYDVALVPTDHFANTWEAGKGSGGMYDFSVRYKLSEMSYVRAGWHSFGFHLPGEPIGSFQGHRWLGPYLAIGMRF